MKSYDVEDQYQISSKGNQIKYKKDGYWYKINNLGDEAEAEELTSLFLSCSDIKIPYVSYEKCIINGHKGCRSKDFLKAGEQTVTFEDAYRNITGRFLPDDVRLLDNARDRIDFVSDFMWKNLEVDVRPYLSAIIETDYIIKNPDRHYNNLCLVLESNGTYRPAPIFDSGQGLGQNYLLTPPNCSLSSFLRIKDAAFGSFENALEYVGFSYKVDYEKLKEKLYFKEETDALRLLKANLNKIKKCVSNGKNTEAFAEYCEHEAHGSYLDDNYEDYSG